MHVIINHRALFLHIPKCAGSSVVNILRSVPCELHRARRRNGASDDIDMTQGPFVGRFHKPQPFTFCFVRHPLAWYESFWKYRTRPGGPRRSIPLQDDWQPMRQLIACKADTFDEFMQNILERTPGWVSRYYEWLIGDGRFIDMIGRVETFANDLSGALSRFGVSIAAEDIAEMPHKNVSIKSDITWDNGIRREVLAAESVAINRFHYGSDNAKGILHA